MAKRSDAIFVANMPRRKNRRIGAIVSGIGLVIFLVTAVLLMPREIGVWPQRLLGLLCAAWAWLTWWLATYYEESPEELLYRLRRSQSSDFGKQLLANRPKQRTVKLPGAGEVAVVTLLGPVVFLLAFGLWFSPLAPVRVSTLKIEELTIPLGEQIIAGALILPDGHCALTAPPAVPLRALQIAKVMRDGGDPYKLGLKAIAEGRFDDARKLLETAAKDGKGDAVRIALARGQNEIYAGKFDAAVPLFEAALEKSPDNPTILCQLAMALIHQGQFASAEPHVAQAVKADAKGAAGAGAIHVQSLLSLALGKNYEKTQEMCALAREKLKQAGEDEQQNLIAPASLNNQAVLYVLCGKYYGAAELFRAAQDGWQQLSGQKHPDAALVLSNLATLDACLARYDEAKNRFAQALAIGKEDGSWLPLRRVAAMCGLASVHAHLADFDSGRALAEETRVLAEKELGAEHRILACVYRAMGDLSAGEGRYSLADGHFLRAEGIAKGAWGATHPFLAAILNDHTALHIDRGRYPEAGLLIKQVLDICNLVKATDRVETADALYHRGLALVRQDKLRGVRADLDKALSIQREVYGDKNSSGGRLTEEEHPDIARTLGCLASLDNSPLTYPSGVSLFAKAIAMAEKFLGADHPTVADLLVSEAKLHLQRDKAAQALECLEKALEIEKKRLPQWHPMITSTLELTATVCEKLDPPQTDRAKQLRTQAEQSREEYVKEDQSE